ncbi:MAG: hypothetical protein GY782_02070 [Gammaproteobacteria bacterium]|nr:hypothetical protein [Gammaproteobacteria bacterium]
MKDKLAYENIANELGKFFEPRGRWALLGWLGIVLLLFTGFALSPLTGGLSGVAATAVSAAIIPAGTVGGIGTIGGWGIFARRKYKVSQMRSLPNTFFPPQSTKVDDKTLSHEIDDDESQLDLSLTSAL